MSRPDPRAAAAQAVELQRNYLRNPLPLGSGVCRVCRGAAGAGFDICYQCNRHQRAAAGQLADVVVPVAYSVKGTQHAHNLIVYKSDRPSAQAQYNLSALGLLFFVVHGRCVERAISGRFTHVATVPSTRGRQGTHPLEMILTSRLGLPAVTSVATTRYANDDREFHPDRFEVAAFAGPPGQVRVLLVDDTWTTGARLQSLAFALKASGAGAVAAVVLGRHVNPQYELSKPLVDRLRVAGTFDPARCAVEDLAY